MSHLLEATQHFLYPGGFLCPHPGIDRKLSTTLGGLGSFESLTGGLLRGSGGSARRPLLFDHILGMECFR